MYLMNSMLVWNYRGAISQGTLGHLCNMVEEYKLAIVALLETHTHSTHAKPFMANSRFTKLVATEAMGFIGGIWLLWDATIIIVEVVSIHE